MVPPTGFAETVMPPSFSPPAAVIVPLKMASASAVAGTIMAAALIRKMKRRAPFMCRLPLFSFLADRSSCGRGGDRFQIRDDGLDLGRLEMILEAGHAGRAVADDVSHHGLLTAGRILRQLRTVKGARQLRLGMADAAGLIEQPHAQKLLVVECLIARRLGAGTIEAGCNQKRKHCDDASHRAPPAVFLQSTTATLGRKVSGDEGRRRPGGLIVTRERSDKCSSGDGSRLQ